LKPSVATKNTLEGVLEAKSGERILILTDDMKREVGYAFAEGALDLGLWTRMLVLETEENVFRSEIPAYLNEIFNSFSPPDIYINILRGPAEERPFRIKIIELETRKKRSRLGHCPGITMDMLTKGALSLTSKENIRMQDNARNLLALLQNVDTVHVNSPSGSDFTFNVNERTWFSDTFIDWKQMSWMNLPTGEVIVGPVETSMQGTLVCDLAVEGIGPLKSPVHIEVKNGRVETVFCDVKRDLNIIKGNQAIDEMAKYVGEFAIGLNPKARIIEEFLESEKVGNTIHVAFGYNMDYPGNVANNSATHQDFLVDKPTVEITYSDGQTRKIMEKGQLIPL